MTSGSPLTGLGAGLPVLAAPMAGGPSTPALVAAAANAGGLGFLAAGYRTPEDVARQISAARAAGVSFGVNVFAPNPVPVDPDEYRTYARAVQMDADRYGLTLAVDDPVEDDDYWSDKIDLLLGDPVPVVGFTFGIPDRSIVAALRKAGTIVVQTVTSPEEARQAADAGPDMLVAQSSAAGGHLGTLTPHAPPPPVAVGDLVTQVRRGVALPVIAAGGLATPGDISAALAAGAVAAMVGTVLLRTHESGASATHQAAVAEDAGRIAGAQGHRVQRDTVVTRAFSGRPARGLRNDFIDRHDAAAPLGYPALHHLTSPLRKAAAAAGDPELVNLWAGTGWRSAKVEPAARVLARLAGG